MITVSHDPIDVDIALRQGEVPVRPARLGCGRGDRPDPGRYATTTGIRGRGNHHPGHRTSHDAIVKQRDRGPIRTSA